MAPARLLERNVKPVRGVTDEDADDVSDGASAMSASGSENGDAQNSDVEDTDDMDMEHETEDYGQDISNVSFGALQQAQEALSRKRKRGSNVTEDQEEKLNALRSRLKQIKSEQKHHGDGSAQKKKRVMHTGEFASDSDSAPSEIGGSKSRTSKHAPASQSTKYQVTRKRTVVDVPKRVSRDPRFDALHQDAAPNGNLSKAYSFLRDYQKSEIAELKAAIKIAKSEGDKETLRRKLVSMENRIKSEDAKAREQEVKRKHRKEEKERIEQGKTPFFLKRKEIKERALVEKFKGMKGKDRQKLIERRRRKEDQKEKKKLPDARRSGG